MAGVRALAEMHGHVRFEQEGNLLLRASVGEDVHSVKDGVTTIVLNIVPEDACNLRIIVNDVDLLSLTPRIQGTSVKSGTPLILEMEQI